MIYRYNLYVIKSTQRFSSIANIEFAELLTSECQEWVTSGDIPESARVSAIRSAANGRHNLVRSDTANAFHIMDLLGDRQQSDSI